MRFMELMVEVNGPAAAGIVRAIRHL